MTSLSKFPLLKLPLLAFQSVLKNFQFSDLIHFSFSSKRIKYHIKLLKIKFCRFDVHLGLSKKYISLLTPKTYIKARWYFNSSELVEKSENMAATICMNHLKLMSLAVDQKFYTYTDGDVVQSAKTAFGYLNELFSCPLPAIFISTRYILRTKKPYFFGLRECSELFIEGEDKIRRAKLRSIRQEVVIRKRLSLNIPMRNDFKFNIATIKHLEEICIRDAHWVKSKNILKLNCSHMLLNGVKWTAKGCETFVARWLNSDDTFFCFSRLYWNDRVPEDLNFENLGVELREFDPEIRDPAYRYTKSHLAFDVSNGRDIIRKDGLMATVAVSEHTFIFCVWHERHQNMNGVTITNRLT